MRAARRVAIVLGAVLVTASAAYTALAVAGQAGVPDAVRVGNHQPGRQPDPGNRHRASGSRSASPGRQPGQAASDLVSGPAGRDGSGRPRDLPRRPALVIAHRGASDQRPENTLGAYRLAVTQGADFLEGDLVSTRDGVLVVRHERELAMTTDVAAHPEFARLRTSKVIDGTPVTNWFVEDFTLAELRTLRATLRHRASEVPPRPVPPVGRVPDSEAIPTAAEMINLVRTERAAGHHVGLYVELKFPGYFASIGLPLEQRLAAALRDGGMAGADAPAFVESFDAGSLRTMHGLVGTPLIQLIGGGWNPADPATSTQALAAVAGYAAGIGLDRARLLPPAATGSAGQPGTGAGGPPDPTLVTAAHAAGLEVHVYTFSDPAAGPAVLAGYRGYLAAGVDGVFTNDPAIAREALR